jgi:hypothetical protein
MGPAALTALVAGVLGAVVCVCLIVVDELDESELIMVTRLWFFPIVFGLYGFVSQRLLRRIFAGHTEALSQAARMSMDVAGFWALPELFPFLVLRWRSSLLVSLDGAVFRAVLLWFFFAAVFPPLWAGQRITRRNERKRRCPSLGGVRHRVHRVHRGDHAAQRPTVRLTMGSGRSDFEHRGLLAAARNGAATVRSRRPSLASSRQPPNGDPHVLTTARTIARPF